MKLDRSWVLVGLLTLLLVFAGCTRARVTDTSDIPPISVAPASAADEEPPVSGEGETQTAAQASAAVSLDPDSPTINVDRTVVVNIQIQDVSNLFGADIRLEYDPSVVEVVDDNTLVPGTQINSGDFPDIDGGRGFVAQNEVDPEEGTIGYAMTLLNPAEPVDGSGTLASITFRGKAVDTSDVTFTSVLLSDDNANRIPVTKSGATITVAGEPAPTETPTPAPTQTPAPGLTPTPAPTSTPSQCTYTVKAGDTLFSIAGQFGVAVSDIAQANGITDVDQIFVGQKLIVPDCEPDAPSPPPAGECTTYVVQRGDTLFSLARRFGTTVDAIALRNNIVNPSQIFVGQELTICPEGTTPPPEPPSTGCTYYTVQGGDTLFSIALRFGSTVPAISRANNITNQNLIFVGQKLCIPK